jgi:ABC-2 type transport system permease protein
MTTADTTAATALDQRNQRPPGVLAVGLARASVELKGFFREKDTVIFTFSLPIIMLLILGSVFTGEVEGLGVTVPQLFTAGMIAGGVASTSFITLGAGVATDRENGTLKRLRGTPMHTASYFLGKVMLVLAVSLAEVVLLLTVGVVMFDLALPTAVDAWVTFTWVFLIGVAACSLLGLAVASLARNARSASAMSNLGLLVLMFASGVYFIPLSSLPQPLIQFGSLFPMKWMAQGFRSVFLPDAMAFQEVSGAWEHSRVALVLAAWCIGGLVLCLTTFRWRGQREN